MESKRGRYSGEVAATPIHPLSLMVITRYLSFALPGCLQNQIHCLQGVESSSTWARKLTTWWCLGSRLQVLRSSSSTAKLLACHHHHHHNPKTLNSSTPNNTGTRSMWSSASNHSPTDGQALSARTDAWAAASHHAAASPAMSAPFTPNRSFQTQLPPSSTTWHPADLQKSSPGHRRGSNHHHHYTTPTPPSSRPFSRWSCSSASSNMSGFSSPRPQRAKIGPQNWRTWHELKIKVVDLPFNTTTLDIYKLFECEGEISRIELQKTSRTHARAFVSFRQVETRWFLTYSNPSQSSPSSGLLGD